MFFHQKCEIINLTHSKQFGEASAGTPVIYDCRCESENGFSTGGNGRVPSDTRLYLMPKNTVVRYGDKVRLTESFGVVINEGYQVVSKVFPVGGSSLHHYEVSTGGGK